MENKIEAGDYVKHDNLEINGGLKFIVDEVNESGTQALCSFFKGVKQVHTIEWLPIEELKLVEKGEDGFVNGY